MITATAMLARASLPDSNPAAIIATKIAITITVIIRFSLLLGALALKGFLFTSGTLLIHGLLTQIGTLGIFWFT